MYGAILGDIIGSPYEFDRGDKTKDFPLFSEKSHFTDDTVMTIAVAKAFMDLSTIGGNEPKYIPMLVEGNMQQFGKMYPDAGYGGMFQEWLFSKDPRPYYSFGNGAAMRVSIVGWMYKTRWRTVYAAAQTAKVTHDHPEGIKGACATAEAIWMSRMGFGKKTIKERIQANYDYNLDRTLDEIRPGYHHVESCQETVPEAIIAFLEGNDFEDVIRNAVSLGGDSDTLACIAGSIAEAYFIVPEDLREEARKRIPPEMRKVLDWFDIIR